MKKISQLNLDYSVRYDYQTYKSCESSGCNDDGICRCGEINNAHITSVDIESIANSIYSIYFPDDKSTKRNNTINTILYGAGKEIDLYCIDRILRSYKIYNKDNWDISVIRGYYGEEIGDVLISQSLAVKIQHDIDKLFTLQSLNEKINFILEIEYGYLLPELKGKSYEVVEISKKDVVFGQEGHYKKIQTYDLDHYLDVNYSGIKGLVIESNGKYRVIDGYHRLYKTTKDKVKVILVK